MNYEQILFLLLVLMIATLSVFAANLYHALDKERMRSNEAEFEKELWKSRAKDLLDGKPRDWILGEEIVDSTISAPKLRLVRSESTHEHLPHTSPTLSPSRRHVHHGSPTPGRSARTVPPLSARPPSPPPRSTPIRDHLRVRSDHKWHQAGPTPSPAPATRLRPLKPAGPNDHCAVNRPALPCKGLGSPLH